MHKTKIKRISLAVLLAFMPLAANAAGLGKLNVSSGLGEPLSAEIEVLSATPEELAGMSATIAPTDAYAQQGIERPGYHNQIKIDLRKKADGKSVLKLSTAQPINDPFIDMLVEVNWASGKLLREFTVLLDPPGYDQTSSNTTNNVTNSVTNAPVNSTSQAGNVYSATEQTKRIGRKSIKKPVAENNEAAPVAKQINADDITHTTVAGDTLASIAKKNAVDGVSLDQMLAGLYRSNENAFIHGNINRLKVGQIIRVPSATELQSISPSEATQEIKVHSKDWQAYKNKLADEVEKQALTGDEASNQVSKGKLIKGAEDKSIPPSKEPKDIVKLSKAEPTADTKAEVSKSGAEEAKAAKDKITALQEQTLANEKNLQEANARTAMLEKQIQDMQKLLEIKNKALADAQTQSSAQATAKSAPAVAPEQKPAAAEKPTAEPAPHHEKPKVVVHTPPPAPVEEPSFLDSLGLDSSILSGAGIAIAGLLGGWLYTRNRRKRGLDGFEKSILTAGGLKANTVFGNTLGGAVDTGDTSFLTDFSQSGGGMIDTNDVDPIAEAEVYMAYGRDRQAEEILKDAISKEPKRYELHMKLLELYLNRKDTSAFEAIAGELYTSLGTSHPVWHKVAEMGKQLEPDNPLYNTTTPVDDEFTATNSRLNAADFAQVEVGEKPSLDFSVADDAPATDLDVDFGQADPSAMLDDVESDSPLDFDLGAMEPINLEPESENASDLMAGESDPFAELSEITEELDFSIAGDANSIDVESDTEETVDFNLDNTMQFNLASEEDAQDDVAVEEIAELMPDIELGSSLSDSAPVLSNDEVESESAMDFALPDVDSESDTPALVSNDLDVLPDLDLTDSTPASERATEEISLGTLDSEDVADISFDLPDAVETTNDLAIDLPVEDNALDNSVSSAPSFDQTIVMNSKFDAEDVVFDTPKDEIQALDLDFDLDTPSGSDLDIEEIDMSADMVSEAVQEAPVELDLSGISLDLGDAVNTEDSIPELDIPESNPIAGGESPEVDTKLDLVTAYVDMGDLEGAKELLEEVIQEGGPNQQQKAQEILKSLA